MVCFLVGVMPMIENKNLHYYGLSKTQYVGSFNDGSLSKLQPERNEVFLVGKRDYTPTVLLWHWEKILEDI